jgi:hypothetical protein
MSDQLPEQRRLDALSQPVIHLHLEAEVPAERLSQLLKHVRRLRGAETVDLTISRVAHPAMPGAALADIAVLTLDGVSRVRGVGRTPHAAIEKARARLAMNHDRRSS